MKTRLLLSIAILFVQIGFAQFITTWETTFENQQITIPTNWSEYNYNYTVNWGDGTVTTNHERDASHVYATRDTYTITITGTFPAIYFGPRGSRLRIKTIEQWGNNPWLSMNHAFVQCENLVINATDAPNLSVATDMSYMFLTSGMNQNIDHWDVSNIRNMESIFHNSDFNQDIGNWNVSNVTNMSKMFFGTYFNHDIGNWNVSNVTNMEEMFAYTDYFNKDIGGWNVSNVTNMKNMFRKSINFNQNIGNWNVSSVTDMYGMFEGASDFNQNIGNWNVLNVKDMNLMFNDAIVFNQNIGNWNVSSVIDMSSMFNGAHQFNQDISNWNVSSVTSMRSMFEETFSFNQNIGSWDVSSVENMDSMFRGDRTAFNQNIGNWNVSSVTNLDDMFRDNKVFNQNIGNWNVSSVTKMDSMFSGAINFNQDIGNWDVSSVEDMDAVFGNALAFNQDLSGWDVSNVTRMSATFYNASAFDQDLSNWNVSKVTRMSSMLSESGLSRTNYDKLLIKWASLVLEPGVTLGATDLIYCASETARNILTSPPNNWNITGDSKDCTNLTVIPDQNFEQYLIDENIDSDNTINGKVLTVDIENIEELLIPNKNIADLTGIEGFTNLKELSAANNQITTLNTSSNLQLEKLFIANNQITTVDFSKNLNLTNIDVGENLLTEIDVHFLEDLESLSCYKNQLTEINLYSNEKLVAFLADENQLKIVDIRNNPNFYWLSLEDNALEYLTVKNIDYENIVNSLFSVTGNSNLTCIEVDNEAYSTTNWLNRDTVATFSESCAPSNDDCANAIPLLFGQETPGDVNSGTITSTPSCVVNTVVADVWYSIEVPQNGEFSIQPLQFAGGIIKLALYEDCSLQNEVACGENIAISNITAGDIYYLKVWLETSGSPKTTEETGSFSIIARPTSVLSTKQFDNNNLLTVFPNPAKHLITVSLPAENIKNIELYTVLGERVFQENNINNITKNIQVNHFPKGVYFIKIITNTKKLLQKLIIN